MPQPEAGDVLVVAPRPEIRGRLGTAATTATTRARTSATVPEDLARGPAGVVVVDYDGLAPSERARLRHQMLARRDLPSLVLCSDGDYGLAELCQRAGLNHIVANNGRPGFSEIAATVAALVEGSPLGLESHFADGTLEGIAHLTDSSLRDAVIAAAEGFAIELGTAGRLVNAFVTVTDELMTNALYNAPVDVDGRHRHATSSRQDRVELGSDEAITVRWVGDADCLGVSVSDPFGSLRVEQVRSFLAAHLRADERTPHRGPGGARLGLRLAFAAASRIICNIAPGQRTEIIAFVDTDTSYRIQSRRAKSFHIHAGREACGRRWAAQRSTTGVDPIP
ncbi:MAG: hypothetical protein AAF721_03755 [Myxococcota bacterium]